MLAITQQAKLYPIISSCNQSSESNHSIFSRSKYSGRVESLHPQLTKCSIYSASFESQIIATNCLIYLYCMEANSKDLLSNVKYSEEVTRSLEILFLSEIATETLAQQCITTELPCRKSKTTNVYFLETQNSLLAQSDIRPRTKRRKQIQSSRIDISCTKLVQK